MVAPFYESEQLGSHVAASGSQRRNQSAPYVCAPPIVAGYLPRTFGPAVRVTTVSGPSALRLRPLHLDDESEFRAAHRELAAEDFEFGFGLDTVDVWSAYVERLDRWRHDPPEGMVPATFLVADVGGDLVGRVSVRHELDEFLSFEGGHIGYAVRPAFRRRGHATAILEQSLIIARAAGVDSILVTCDVDNRGSIAVIEACGGQPDGEAIRGNGVPFRRYRIG